MVTPTRARSRKRWTHAKGAPTAATGPLLLGAQRWPPSMVASWSSGIATYGRGDPMDDTRRCTATSKRTRVRCKKAPLLGAMVCRTHGGGAPQVRRKAAERLADLIDPNRALREAARLAYSDVGALFDEDGHLRPVHTLPPEVRAAIASIEI